MNKYTGVRCIGGRTSVRTLEALRSLSDKVIGLSRNYREIAITAVRQGSTVVYMPAALSEAEIDGFFRRVVCMESFGNLNGEPVYPNLETANKGRNDNGTTHNGYLVVDVLDRLVVDLINRDGTTRLSTPLVRFASAGQVIF